MKRFLSILLATVMVMGVLFAVASCGSKTGEKDLDEVKAKGEIVVGMECAYAPYNWAQATSNEYASVPLENGTYADGYDVQIAKYIAAELGMNLEIVANEWDSLIPAVQSGAVDGIIAGMSPTEERMQEVDFTHCYYRSNLVIIYKK